MPRSPSTSTTRTLKRFKDSSFKRFWTGGSLIPSHSGVRVKFRPWFTEALDFAFPQTTNVCRPSEIQCTESSGQDGQGRI